jgi:hypothetical protein
LGRVYVTFSPTSLPGQRQAERAVRGVDRDVGLVLARADEEALGLVVALVEDLDDHAGTGDARARRRLADLGVAQQLGELADAGLELALLVLGGVVAAVLLEVALVARGLDLGDDVGAPGPLASSSSADSRS